ncbi:hypothetical protein LCGC14_1370450 [marine sediment metagenome]|uniref:Methyltransferase type 11 domain-containing protein n=1 Tax=marine sediment metagenome TaxID=412755 RepID=A0A0F9KRH6_9ZZZZ
MVISLDNLTSGTNKKSKIISKYNSSSAFYDNRYRKIQERKYQIILNNYDLNEKFILDLGCGTGLLFTYFINLKNEQKDNFYFYVAIDISWKMLLEFKSKLNKFKAKNKLSLVLSDIENLPFRANIFYSVFSLTSFQNLPNINKGVKESIRVSRDNANFKFSILKKQ